MRGHEDFWRAGAHTRGSIAVVQPSSAPLNGLLDDCVLFGMPSTRYQLLKANSAAALRFAEEHPRTAERIFLFSQSNGVEHVEIFPARGQEAADYLLTERVAKQPGWRE